MSKSGFVYLLTNSNTAKFGATKHDIKSRVNYYNSNNKDKYSLSMFVLSPDPFAEENDFRWFLNSNNAYFMSEFFPLEYAKLFFEFFNDRVVFMEEKE